MTKAKLLILLFIALNVIAACNGKKADAEETSTTETNTVDVVKDDDKESDNTSNTTPPQDEATLKKFLHSTEGTYGWKTAGDEITFDFFQDGRLHIQGADGEASMWEGTWKLQGDQLTIDRKDLNKTVTVTVKQDGDKLLLDDKAYTRIRL